MSIESGNNADADEVMNAIGSNFADNAQLLWSADLIGFNSLLNGDGDISPLRVFYDTLQNTTKIDTANSDVVDFPVYGANVSDDFEDSSIDSNIWSTSITGTGAVGETGGKLRFTWSGTSPGSAQATADQVNSIDFNQQCTIFTRWEGAISGAPAKTFAIRITDGSTTITLKSKSDAFSVEDIRIEVDPTGNEAIVYTNDINAVAGGSTIDLTSLSDGATWSINLFLNQTGSLGSAASMTMQVHFLRYLLNSIVAKDLVSEATTSSSTITNAILTTSTDTTFGSIDCFLSADNGANYEAVTVNEIHRFTNTGTQLKLKATLNSTVDKVPILYHWAAKYNFY